MLKNNNNTLPLNKNISSIALIGPIAKAKSEHLGFWSFDWPDDSLRISSIYEGIKAKTNAKLHYAKGCGIKESISNGFEEAFHAAKMSEVIVLCLGEARDMTGEARSRSNIHLPEVQEKLIDTLSTLGKPMIILLHSGRPMIIQKATTQANAVLYNWWLGTEAGHATANVLFGEYNPSAKLTMTFPRDEGQIPIYYNKLNTGRPASKDDELFYVSAYNDLPNSPAFPFGFGLSYSEFNLHNIKIDNTSPKGNTSINISCDLLNKGKYDGEIIIQLYIRDVTASIVQPIKKLVDFKKIMTKSNTTTKVNFTLSQEQLTFLSKDLKPTFESGEFHIMVGLDSEKVLSQKVWWEE